MFSFLFMSLIVSDDHKYVQTLHNVADAIKNAEYILVGGAAGMSTAGGPNPYDPNDPIYLANFKDMEYILFERIYWTRLGIKRRSLGIHNHINAF